MPPPELPQRGGRKREEREVEEQIEDRPKRKKPKDWTLLVVLVFIVPGFVYFMVKQVREMVQEERIEQVEKQELKIELPQSNNENLVPEKINYLELYELYRGNRPATLNKYKGKLIEVNTASARIIGGDEEKIQLEILIDQPGTLFETSTFRIEAVFSFYNQKNKELKSFKSGPFKRTIIGRIADIDNLTLNREGVSLLLTSSAIVK